MSSNRPGDTEILRRIAKLSNEAEWTAEETREALSDAGIPPEDVTSRILQLVTRLKNQPSLLTGRHFLERFLDAAARLLHVPWWAIHLALYLATSAAFIVLFNLQKLYPNAGQVSFWGEQIGEFMFTTLMLYHLRKSRTVAASAVAQISTAEARIAWLRQYGAPSYQGWMLRWKNSKLDVKAWCATVLVLIAYYCGLFVYERGLLHGSSRDYWDLYFPYPQLVYIYPTVAKAAMIVAGAAHFWWLYGLMSIVRDRFPSSLDSGGRQILRRECGRAAIRLSVGVSLATLVWVMARALVYTPTFWVYLYSVWLIVLFVAQVAIINGRPRFFRELIALDWAFSGQSSRIGRFATGFGLWLLFLCPPPLAQAVASLGK